MKPTVATLFCLAGLTATSAAYAQVADNTTLVGTVTDASGAVVPNATVSAVNTATKVQYTGKTNGEGYYSIPFVAPGSYDVTVEEAGYSKVVSRGTTVILNQSARTDVVLTVGSENTEVTVTTATPALSTDDSVIGETLDETKVVNLPVPGRRAIDLATTASNVITQSGNPYTGNPPGVAFIGAGTRPVTNSVTLDGITVMNSLGSLTPVNPNADALEAVQVQTGNYTAQYGSYMGVHVNMDTKRGTNDYHGTVYEYVQNDFFNAKSFFTRPTTANPHPRTPELRFNQFGGEIGGPVRTPGLFNGRDRLFFMGSYEGLRQIQQSQATATVLTQAMRNGDFSALYGLVDSRGNPAPIQLRNPATGANYANNQVTNISPVSTKLLNYMPLPNTTGSNNGTTNNLNTTVPTNVNIDSTLDRVDYAVNEKVRLFGRYYYQKLQTVSGSPAPTSNSYSPTTDSNAVFGYTHILTPKLINDFRIGYNKLNTNLLNYFAQNNIQGAGSALGIAGFTSDVDNNNPGIPSINITNFQGLGSDGTNWYQDDRTIHGYDQISWSHGRHNIMAGVELRRMTIGRAAQNAPRGSFTFSSAYSGYSASDFLTGYAQTVATPVTEIKGSVGEWRDGFFVQDNWQVTQKLTLLYGLRYELPTVPYSLNGNARIINQQYTALIPATTATTGAAFTPVPGFKFIGPNHDNWAPRIGFAYRATDKITVRGGGGIYYNPNHLNSFTLATGNYPLAATTTYNGASSGLGTLSFANPTGTGAPMVSCVPGNVGCYTSVFNDNYYLPTPRLYQWNLDTGTELWRNAGLEMQYLGSRAIDLDHSLYPNQPRNVDPRVDPRSVNVRRPNQLFGQIRQIQNDGFSTYHALNVALRQRLSHGLDMSLGYTWSHTLDTSADANGGGTPMIQYNLRADYGNANWDVRNRFVGVVSYTFPELRGRNGAVRLAAGGWQANTIVTLQSGQPFNIGISSDQANAGNLGTQRPVLVGQNRETCGGSNAIYGTSCVQVAGIYSLPALGTYSTMHRNDNIGPGYENVNLSVFKNFPIRERLAVQLRLEAFNAFNHVNPANPNTTLGSVAALAPSAPSNPTGRVLDPSTGLSQFSPSTFGTITSVQNNFQNGGGSRLLQIAGKINF